MTSWGPSIRSCIAGLVLLAFVASPVAAAERIALVVGNSQYAGGQLLRNPVRDARAVGKALEALEFQVNVVENADQRKLKDAIRMFARQLGKGKLGLFYYAGHGIQVKGVNYLIPIGADIEEEFDVSLECLDLGYVLQAMEANENSLNVLVLDCCRDNQFKRSWTRSNAQRGLAAIDIVPDGTIIAFSTAPGRTADDGRGDNSPYTKHFVRALAERPNNGTLVLQNVFGTTARRLKEETGQRSWANIDLSIPQYALWRGATGVSAPPPKTTAGVANADVSNGNGQSEMKAVAKANVPKVIIPEHNTFFTESDPRVQGDFRQWGGSSHRNNAPIVNKVPLDWKIGQFDSKGRWLRLGSQNIKWVAQLGSRAYGNAVVADGQVYVGTNNAAGYLKRFPAKTDLGCLLALSEQDGTLVWQHSSEKLPTGRHQDWPEAGVCSAPLVEGDRLWFVTNRCEVVCLDTRGFRDELDQGDRADWSRLLAVDKLNEADEIWKFDMRKELNVSPHNMSYSSVTAIGDILFVVTSNGMDESHINLPSPNAPSFMALNKNTGKVFWTDASPGANILHGQWSSPAAGVLGGVPQVIFAGGDGWVYSFKADEGKNGKPELLWKFDANPKTSKWIIGGRGDRNNILATPVIHDGLVYVAVGQEPEHAEGDGHLWCINPKLRGDVSPQIALSSSRQPLAHRRVQAVDPARGEVAVDNPNSAVVWHYAKFDSNNDGTFDFDETFHRTISNVTVSDGLLFAVDLSGLVHCLDAKTGKRHWVYDVFAAIWGSPLVAGGHVYIGDEDGKVSIFKVSAQPHEPVAELEMGAAVYTTPIIANDVLYIATSKHLFAIQEKD